MKAAILTIAVALLASFANAQVNPYEHYVNGYIHWDGSYTPGYWATDPNSTNRDNYSTYPNINPHTGQQGRIQPDPDTHYFTVPSSLGIFGCGYRNFNSAFPYQQTNDGIRTVYVDGVAWSVPSLNIPWGVMANNIRQWQPPTPEEMQYRAKRQAEREEEAEERWLIRQEHKKERREGRIEKRAARILEQAAAKESHP